MPVPHFKAPGVVSGFSLLEVLIASTIFSVGLAGLAALFLSSHSGAIQARHASIAAVAASNLAEQIRLNSVAIDRYLKPVDSVSHICLGNIHCTPDQQADYDYKIWQIELASRIKNARGLVCNDGTPGDGVEGNDHCDGTGPLVIKILWPNPTKTGPARAGATISEWHRFTLEIG